VPKSCLEAVFPIKAQDIAAAPILDILNLYLSLKEPSIRPNLVQLIPQK